MTSETPQPVDFAAVTSGLDGHHNFVLAGVNDHCLRIAVFEGTYRWHRHPGSDELFVVVEGRLEIDLDEGTVVLGPGQAYLVAAGVRHRSRATMRTVNLCFEREDAQTIFDD
ncbi:cupin domain-containing protein [Salinarimonas rosea]|uniref:cupin domain-containing protein n=1 Tax=Salinarimonas rosea TaxID=552063 RepID=UPI0003F573EC|nr:cupin domain-containing protein [Salinarimonas rosea]